jgi:hypothetical protein
MDGDVMAPSLPPTCVNVVGHGGHRWLAAESYRLVVVSVGGGLAMVSWWSCSSRLSTMRSEGSSDGAHHLRIGWLSFLYRLGVLCCLFVGLLYVNYCSWLSRCRCLYQHSSILIKNMYHMILKKTLLLLLNEICV